MSPIYFLFLSSLLLIQSSRCVQSIAISRLCGLFGHACLGGNWGKRTVSPEDLRFDLKKNKNEILIDDNAMSKYILEEFRLEIFRERLRQLLEHE